MNQPVSVMMQPSDLRVRSHAALARDKFRLVLAASLAASDVIAIVAGYLTTLAFLSIHANHLPYAKTALAFLMVNALFSFALRSCTGYCLIQLSVSIRKAVTCLILTLMFMSILSLNFNANAVKSGSFMITLFGFAFMYTLALRGLIVGLGKKALEGNFILFCVFPMEAFTHPSATILRLI